MKIPVTSTLTSEPTQSGIKNDVPKEPATATPDRSEIVINIFEAIDCGEKFCQVVWPGVLERPIGSNFRTTIDLAYPYASTRDGALDPHHGVEFPNLFGTPVLAAGAGKIIFAGTDAQTILGPFTGFYGNVVILEHSGLFEGKNVFTLYAHLSEIDVLSGEHVDQGEAIGKVGASGAADGSHLHFEVRLGVNDYEHTLNPVLWFSPVHLSDTDQTSSLSGMILDRKGNPLPELDLALEKLRTDGTIEERFYPETYINYEVNPHPKLRENFTVPDIPPGDYRLAFVSGKVFEVFFTLEPGALGFVQIQVD